MPNNLDTYWNRNIPYMSPTATDYGQYQTPMLPDFGAQFSGNLAASGIAGSPGFKMSDWYGYNGNNPHPDFPNGGTPWDVARDGSIANLPGEGTASNTKAKGDLLSTFGNILSGKGLTKLVDMFSAVVTGGVPIASLAGWLAKSSTVKPGDTLSPLPAMPAPASSLSAPILLPSGGTTTSPQIGMDFQNLYQRLLNSTNAASLANSIQQQTNSNYVSPLYAQQQTDLYRTQAPQLAQTGVDVNRINALGNAATDAQVAAGPGRDSVRAQTENLAISDPQFTDVRAATGDKFLQMLASINPTGQLSGSEREEITRAQRQGDTGRGLLEAPSNINTVANAMEFGSAVSKKQQAQLPMFSAATNFLQPSKSGISSFGTPTPNPGGTQFLGVQAPSPDLASSQSGQLGGNLLSNLFGLSGTQGTNATNAGIAKGNRDAAADASNLATYASLARIFFDNPKTT